MLRMTRLFFVALMAAVCCAQTPSTPTAITPDSTAAHKVPVIDGAAGSCSLDLTVNADGQPVYAAIVKVHIKYGFGGFHRLDLQASTNIDGKVKFTGIPTKIQRPPLEFDVSKDQLTATVNYDPTTECQASKSVALEKVKEQTK